MMTNFIKRLIVFLFPIIFTGTLISFLPVFMIILSKEYYGIEEVVSIQQSKNVLVNKSIVSADRELKLFTTEYLKPDILAVGTSRVMQFRRSSFQNATFYNAGGGASNLRQYREFLSSLDHRPRIVILGLDQYFFNQNYALKNQDSLPPRTKMDYRKLYVGGLRLFYSNITVLSKLNNFPDNIGLAAICYSDGFRSDGSYYYRRRLEDPDYARTQGMVYPFDDTLDRIKTGTRRFEYGTEVYPESVRQTAEILQVAKERNIHIVGFLPPYAPEVNRQMNLSGNYAYIDKIFENIRPLFERYGHEVYNFTDMRKVADDSMFIDGFHGGESVYNMILTELKNEGSALAPYIQ